MCIWKIPSDAGPVPAISGGYLDLKTHLATLFAQVLRRALTNPIGESKNHLLSLRALLGLEGPGLFISSDNSIPYSASFEFRS